MKKKILIGSGVLLVILQVFRTDMTLPASDANMDFFASETGSAEEVSLIKTACYDCHSHQTSYPWYTKIQPIGVWTHGHVKNGREHVNFSEWSALSVEDKKHALKECAEVLEKKEMPMLPYMMLHNEAWLSEEQRTQLASYFKKRSQSL